MPKFKYDYPPSVLTILDRAVVPGDELTARKFEEQLDSWWKSLSTQEKLGAYLLMQVPGEEDR